MAAQSAASQFLASQQNALQRLVGAFHSTAAAASSFNWWPLLTPILYGLIGGATLIYFSDSLGFTDGDPWAEDEKGKGKKGKNKNKNKRKNTKKNRGKDKGKKQEEDEEEAQDEVEESLAAAAEIEAKAVAVSRSRSYQGGNPFLRIPLRSRNSTPHRNPFLFSLSPPPLSLRLCRRLRLRAVPKKRHKRRGLPRNSASTEKSSRSLSTRWEMQKPTSESHKASNFVTT